MDGRTASRAYDRRRINGARHYLQAFTTASKSSKRTLYRSRSTGEPISGSPRVALEATPPFSRAVFFELPSHPARLEAALRSSYPDRDFNVVAGDCHTTIGGVLGRAKTEDWRWAPTFALLDQHAAEIQWARVEAQREERSRVLSLFPPLPKAVMPIPRYKHEPPRQRSRGKVVCCSYWILEADHTMRCHQFATLSLPI